MGGGHVLAFASGQGQEGGSCPGIRVNGLLGALSNGPSPSQGLQAAVVAAATWRAISVDDDMAQLACTAATAHQQVSGGDHPASDTGTNEKADDIRQALAGEDITIFGEGLQTRSFCYVSDLVDGLVRLMNMDDITGPVNLGNPREMTIRELAEQVIRMTGAKSKLEQKPLPGDDPTQRCPDIGLAKKQLGWEPAVALEEGLEKTIQYFKETL